MATDFATQAGHKACRVCGTTKPLHEYHARPASRDGYRNECRACRCARQQAYSRTENGRVVQQQADQLRNVKFPQRRAARTALFNAVKAGRVKPHPCFVCGDKAEAHHPDYSRPLDVVWLCQLHHKQAHELVRIAA